MKTTTVCGSRIDPPPDPLWLPDADWSAEVLEFWKVADEESVFSAAQFSAGQACASTSAPNPEWGPPKGLTGSLVLGSADSLNQELTGAALQRLRVLDGWTASARARLIHRQHQLMVEDLEQFNRKRAAEDSACGRPAVARKVDPALAFTLAATEIATLLGIPEGTARALVDESVELCERCPETLALLEKAEINPAQARTILDQTRSLIAEEVPAGISRSPGATAGQVFPAGAAHAMEQELLKMAPGLTNAQLVRKARRLRERSYPETIPVRHQTAFEQRRVWFQPQPDGMGHLTAYLPADKGQSIFGALTGAARGEQLLGDPRCLDQLRTDILASLLLHTSEPWVGKPHGTRTPDSDVPDDDEAVDIEALDTVALNIVALNNAYTRELGNEPGATEVPCVGAGNPFDVPPLPSGTVPEIMVLINAETLFGVDDAPAELAGYGSISAQEARRLARTACRWTGLAQDPQTGQILGVGRRRKVPSGLRRWLQARDQTCRFPGCSTGAARTEIDHTIPWAHGGPTEHWNLANLCKKHHRLKTLGHWKARQVSPGVLEWISPLGRRYRTQPELTLGHLRAPRTADSHLEPEVEESPPPF